MVSLLETKFVANVAEAVVVPAGTVIVAANFASTLLLERLTSMPLGPAWPFKETEARELEPPLTGFGIALMRLTVAGRIVSLAVVVASPLVAEIVTISRESTGTVVT
jgi:hypothetical protein